MECGKWSGVCGVDSRVKCREWRVPEWSVEWRLGCKVNNGEWERRMGSRVRRSVEWRVEWRVESEEFRTACEVELRLKWCVES